MSIENDDVVVGGGAEGAGEGDAQVTQQEEGAAGEAGKAAGAAAEPLSQEEIEAQPAFKGLLADLQAERRAADTLRTQNVMLTRMLEGGGRAGVGAPPAARAATDPDAPGPRAQAVLAEMQADGIVTPERQEALARAMRADDREERAREDGARTASDRNTRVRASESRLREEFAAKPDGSGVPAELAYDAVVNDATVARLSAEDLAAAFATKDPAREIYRLIVSRTPELEDRYVVFRAARNAAGRAAGAGAGKGPPPGARPRIGPPSAGTREVIPESALSRRIGNWLHR